MTKTKQPSEIPKKKVEEEAKKNPVPRPPSPVCSTHARTQAGRQAGRQQQRVPPQPMSPAWIFSEGVVAPRVFLCHYVALGTPGQVLE